MQSLVKAFYCSMSYAGSAFANLSNYLVNDIENTQGRALSIIYLFPLFERASAKIRIKSCKPSRKVADLRCCQRYPPG